MINILEHLCSSSNRHEHSISSSIWVQFRSKFKSFSLLNLVN